MAVYVEREAGDEDLEIELEATFIEGELVLATCDGQQFALTDEETKRFEEQWADGFWDRQNQDDREDWEP